MRTCLPFITLFFLLYPFFYICLNAVSSCNFDLSSALVATAEVRAPTIGGIRAVSGGLCSTVQVGRCRGRAWGMCVGTPASSDRCSSVFGLSA